MASYVKSLFSNCCSEGKSRFKTLYFSFKVRTFWETHKIRKNLPYGFDESADLLSKRQNEFKLCVLLKKSELYLIESCSN